VSFTKDATDSLFPEHGEALADRKDAFIAAATSTPGADVSPSGATGNRPAGKAVSGLFRLLLLAGVSGLSG
jgi:hypothetical protein